MERDSDAFAATPAPRIPTARTTHPLGGRPKRGRAEQQIRAVLSSFIRKGGDLSAAPTPPVQRGQVLPHGGAERDDDERRSDQEQAGLDELDDVFAGWTRRPRLTIAVLVVVDRVPKENEADNDKGGAEQERKHRAGPHQPAQRRPGERREDP